MKIAFFSPSWPAAQAQNGIATYVDIMTRALTRAGHECVVITPLIKGDVDGNIYLAKTPKEGALQSLSMWLRRHFGQADAVYQERVVSGINAALEEASKEKAIDLFEVEESFGWAHSLKKIAPCPVFVRTHGPHFLVHQGEIRAYDESRIEAERKALSSCVAFSCPSEGVLRDVKSYYGLTDAKASVVPNPIDFATGENDWSLEACDRNMILSVGRFDVVKGADLVLNAFNSLADRFPEARLVVAGKDTGLPDECGSVLKFDAYTKKHFSPAVCSRIQFLGPVDQSELAGLRRQAFLCVSASRFESFHYTVAEALALGCPVVTTKTYGPAEFLKENHDLLLAEKENEQQLANHMAFLLNQPEKAATIGAAGKRAAMAHISADIVVKKYIEFCRASLSNELSPDASGKGA